MHLILALLACGPTETSDAKAPAAAKPDATVAAKAPTGPTFDYADRAKDLNVIFISLDAMRWDHTGAGGKQLTPNLDAFAAEAVQFSHTTAAASWTVPSHMAMWTGLWPTQHGVINKLKPPPDGKGELIFDSLREDIHTFPETLVQKGWEGVAFTGGAGVQKKFGYGRGFTTYLDDKPFAGTDYTGPAAKTWLEGNKDKHFFMFFHGYDVHGQHGLVNQTPRQAVPDYKGTLDGGIEEQAKLREEGLAAIVNPGDPPNLTGKITDEDTRFLHAVYEAKIKELDGRLGEFLAKVKETGLLDKSIIVILGDHGEEFMEHGYLDHGATLCEHQLHVPMMIRFPGGEGKQTIDAPVRTIDVFPTVFDALGVEGPANVSGKSLIPLIRGEKEELPIYAESDYRLFVHLRAAKLGNKKLILDLEDDQRQLFDFAADPDEKNDLSAGDARTTYEMEQRVHGWMQEMNSDPKRFLGVKEEHIKLF